MGLSLALQLFSTLQIIEMLLSGYQFRVGALLKYFSLVKHVDTVGILDCLDAVSHH